MTKEKLMSMPEQEVDALNERVYETKVYIEDRERNIALRRKASEEARSKRRNQD